MNIMTVEFIPAPKKVFSNREWKKIRQCMSQGFFVTDRTEGTVTLEKKPKIYITIECNEEEKKVDFRDRLANFYGTELHTQELYEMFKKDLDNGKVQVMKGETGYCISKVE